MKKFYQSARCWAALAATFFLSCVTVAAEEIATRGGTVYHQAKIERIEPDGITYVHSLGIIKLPFTELPETICRAHGYDPQKAVAYAQEQTARQAARETKDRQLVAAAETRRLAATTARVVAAGQAGADGGPAYIFRQGESEARALEQTVRALGAQMEALKERAAAQAETGIWSPRLWRFAAPVPLTQIDPKSSEERLFTPNYLRQDLRGIYNVSELGSPSPAGR